MDTLSHIVLGAAIGETMLGKRIGRKAMLYGALISNLPDIDVFGIFILSDSQQLLFHRGITHSLLFLLLIPPLLGWLFKIWIKNNLINWMDWTKLFFVVLLSHLILDSLTCYGMGIFEPFSNYRLSFNSIFVADPFYTFPLLIAVSIPVIKKYTPEKAKKYSIIGLIISSCYLLFTILTHNYVQNIMEQSMKEQELAFDRFTVTPTPLNTFLWMGYSYDKKGTWIGYYSIFDKTKKIDYFRVERNDSLLLPFEKDKMIANLKQLSKGNYVITKDDSNLYFNDIRFGQVSGWNTINAPFALSYNLNKNADNKRALNRTKFKESTYDWFVLLGTRIKGK